MHFNITVTPKPDAITAIENASSFEEIIGIMGTSYEEVNAWLNDQPTMERYDSDSFEYHLPVAIEIGDEVIRHYMYEDGFKTPAERVRWLYEAPEQVTRIVAEVGAEWSDWVIEDLTSRIEDFGIDNMNLPLISR